MATSKTDRKFDKVPKFDKVLVANRGEIAVRIIQGLQEMGLGTVAVYSEADRTALHVLMADEAVYIGASPASESYLVGERILNAAKQTGAGAIHPGYGFLSENGPFSRAVEEAGAIAPDVIVITSFKGGPELKRILQEAGVDEGRVKEISSGGCFKRFES